MTTKTAVLLLGHGSRTEGANDAMYRIVEDLRERTGYVVEAGFLELNPPNFEDSMDICLGQGAEQVVVIPYFLLEGAHVRYDLPAKCEEARERHPGLEVILGEALGFHPKLVDVVFDRVEEATHRCE